ncbi:hypothetical protein BSZ21_17370 [Bradyrhizobium canariense]|nr:hypothetical protein BSZ21_17370 [Bradyrhizobium canariense]
MNWDRRRPQDFDTVGRVVKREDIRRSVLVSADLGQHRAWLAEYAGMDSRNPLHQVVRRQLSFIDPFGEHVLPALKNASGGSTSSRAASCKSG